MIFHHPKFLDHPSPTSQMGVADKRRSCIPFGSPWIPPARNLPLRDLWQSPRNALFEHAKERRFFQGGSCFQVAYLGPASGGMMYVVDKLGLPRSLP